MSPISLLELVKDSKDKKLMVCCPLGFWRRGNVEVTCDRYGIPLVDTIEELKEQVKKRLEEIIMSSAVILMNWVLRYNFFFPRS